MQPRQPVDSLKIELTPSARWRLADALTMLMITEATLSLHDVADATIGEALASDG